MIGVCLHPWNAVPGGSPSVLHAWQGNTVWCQNGPKESISSHSGKVFQLCKGQNVPLLFESSCTSMCHVVREIKWRDGISAPVCHCTGVQRDVTASTCFGWRFSCTFSGLCHLLQIILGTDWVPAGSRKPSQKQFADTSVKAWADQTETMVLCPSLCSVCTPLQCTELTLSGSKTHGLWSPDRGLWEKDEVSYQSLTRKKEFNKNIDASMSFKLYEEP